MVARTHQTHSPNFRRPRLRLGLADALIVRSKPARRSRGVSRAEWDKVPDQIIMAEAAQRHEVDLKRLYLKGTPDALRQYCPVLSWARSWTAFQGVRRELLRHERPRLRTPQGRPSRTQGDQTSSQAIPTGQAATAPVPLTAEK